VSGGLAHDPLFLACTRPAMCMGLPMEAWYALVFGTGVGGMYLGHPVYWLLGGIAYLPLRVISNKNPNFFRAWRVWLDTKASVARGILWARSPGMSLGKMWEVSNG
jgi:type IV secretion system protein VirB3